MFEEYLGRIVDVRQEGKILAPTFCRQAKSTHHLDILTAHNVLLGVL